MSYRNDDALNYIFDKTDGMCRFCNRRLAWKNYGRPGKRGAWEVDHSQPQSRGGTHHLNNLFAVCISCNREKSDLTGQEYWRWLG